MNQPDISPAAAPRGTRLGCPRIWRRAGSTADRAREVIKPRSGPNARGIRARPNLCEAAYRSREPGIRLPPLQFSLHPPRAGFGGQRHVVPGPCGIRGAEGGNRRPNTPTPLKRRRISRSTSPPEVRDISAGQRPTIDKPHRNLSYENVRNSGNPQPSHEAAEGRRTAPNVESPT
ncbi:hypothetical protein GTR04_7500 [Trichophyton interdigitale]|nr:hypothetical protein GY631_7494 [Trichophyton interdigitale]KAG8205118.1 hypothetical protein GTR04_7500 [Trichophyton interdigitale]